MHVPHPIGIISADDGDLVMATNIAASGQRVLLYSTPHYTTPGITSGASKAAQLGRLDVVTTDANGNLASDGGEIFKRLDETESGIALAISMENPDLIAGETFGIAFNAGFYEGAEAVSLSAQGVLGLNVFTPGDSVSVSGGVGVGIENGRGDTTVGGRIGAQITFR